MSDPLPANRSMPVGLAVRDRTAIIVALVGVSLVAWFYLWELAQGMVAMDESTPGAALP